MKRQKHRRPPLPESMRRKQPKGQCRWCDTPILKPDGSVNTYRGWHPDCVTLYRIAAFSNDQRRAVWERDRGLCARCGTQTIRNVVIRGFGNTGDRVVDLAKVPYHYLPPTGHLWQADHIRPLVEANGDLAYYAVANLQTLCTKCHLEKGANDRKRRKLEASKAQDGELF